MDRPIQQTPPPGCTPAETYVISILVSKLSSLLTAALLFTALWLKGAKSCLVTLLQLLKLSGWTLSASPEAASVLLQHAPVRQLYKKKKKKHHGPLLHPKAFQGEHQCRHQLRVCNKCKTGSANFFSLTQAEPHYDSPDHPQTFPFWNGIKKWMGPKKCISYK